MQAWDGCRSLARAVVAERPMATTEMPDQKARWRRRPSSMLPSQSNVGAVRRGANVVGGLPRTPPQAVDCCSDVAPTAACGPHVGHPRSVEVPLLQSGMRRLARAEQDAVPRL